MPIYLPNLQSNTLTWTAHPNAEQRQADKLVTLAGPGLLSQRRWNVETIPKSERVVPSPEPEQIVRIPFRPENYGEPYARYEAFQAATKSITHLSNGTGLLSYAFGDLWPEQSGFNDEMAQAFLKEHQLLLTGRDDGVGQRRTRRTKWHDGTGTIEFQQVNAEQIPVAGARIVLTYDSNEKLALVNSSLLPVTEDELPTFDVSRPDTTTLYDKIKQALDNALELKIIFSDIQWVKFGDDERPYEWWILPMIRHGQPYYAAAYRTFFIDTEGDHWAYWLEVDTFEPLWLERRESHDQISYQVYPRPSDVATGSQPRLLDLGGSATNLKGALKVHVDGQRFYDPQDPSVSPVPPISGTSDPRLQLAANVFFHIWEIQFDFSTWLAEIFEDLFSNHEVNNHTIVNPVQELTAILPNITGDGEFIWETGEINLYTGLDSTQPAIEPAFDSTVIIHEGVHAFLHFYYRSFIENSGAVTPYLTTAEAIDEGLAYFYACLHLDDPQWGSYAYGYSANRDLSIEPIKINNIVAAGVGSGGTYTYAIWWARIFWQLSTHTPLKPIIPILLLQALQGLAHLAATTDSLGTNEAIAITTAFNRFADQIYLRAQTGEERDAIKSVWSLCGFTLPTS